MSDEGNPHEQCESCRFIDECPHPEVDLFGSPIPQDNCPKSDKIRYKRKGNYDRGAFRDD